MAVALGVDDELFEEVLRESLCDLLLAGEVRIFQHVLIQCSLNFDITLGVILGHLVRRMTLHVGVDHESSQLIIDLFLDFVANDSEKIETRQDGICQINIVVEIKLRLVDAANRVCGRDHRAASLQ